MITDINRTRLTRQTPKILLYFYNMPRLWIIILQAYVCTLLNGSFGDGLPYDNEYGPDYGSEWIMFLDENGTTHTMNFSSLPTDERGLLFGEPYFYLYTRHNEVAENLEIPTSDDSPIDSQYFNSSNDLKVITHGWLGSEGADWLQSMKNELLKHSDFNVICVDWSELADNPIYPWSAFSTRYVGKRIAKLLVAIRKSYQTDDKNIHLIGHSLGAQVMGYTGMFYDLKVDRITGLDPARPLFELPRMGKDFRLDKTDAEFVDIIHTCGGIYGYYRSFGHADFYPNDGHPRQPGCEGVQEMIEACSHGRSYEFFGESIHSNVSFVAYPCDNWDKFDKGECKDNPTLMGFPASTVREGDFYLHTRPEPEYAKGYYLK